MKPHLSLVPRSPAACRPLIKWVGGKRWFVDLYGDDVFEHATGRYIEPFLGGAAMALHLGVPNMLLGDVEPDLIALYTIVRDRPEELITMLDLLVMCGTDAKTYYLVRSLKPFSDLELAAKVIYLNKLGFNGLFRKNKSGGYNVPYGKQERPMPSAERIRAASAALRGAEIVVGDFGPLINRAQRGDFVYADPPYDNTFSGYTAHRFDTHDQEGLARSLRTASVRGAQIVAHNSDTPLIRDLYSWAEIVEMPERRAVNSDGRKRGEVPCVLLVSRP